MKKIIIISFFTFGLIIQLIGQNNYSQTIRGIVVDQQSQSPIPGAIIKTIDTNPFYIAVSESNGEFNMGNVPIGMHNIEVQMIGYEQVYYTNVKITSGKELVLKIEMIEKVTDIDKVVVTAYKKNKALNDMANVSARSFSVEEANQYAGTWMDPARMAANYAGVMAMGDQRNDIIIRGNSPLGVLWKLEGIDIPNPNHFGSLGTTGGPVSILNNNTLSNSDFFTGAFPAEYGNATAGVFDLNMRNGNNATYEYTAQVSMNGLELGMEGPFSANSKASYLVDYRYSTLQVFDLMGVNFDVSGVPQYQDFTFKINIPQTKAGNISIFGVGGISKIQALSEDRDSDDWSFGRNDLDFIFGSNMGVVGISNQYFFSNTSRIKTVVAISGSQNTTRVDSSFANKPSELYYGDNSYEIKYSVNSQYTKKFNAKNTVNIGGSIDFYNVSYEDSVKRTDNGEFAKLSEANDQTMSLLQTYIQGQHKFSQNFTIYGGFHYQYFTLNNTYSIEPRASAKYSFGGNQSVSAGFGVHSQLQPRLMYYTKTSYPDGTSAYTNHDLDFSKSNQFVVSYDYLINKDLRLKVETYYQHLYNIPVEIKPSTYSSINYGTKFFLDRVDSLENTGTGTNYGLEVTFEKFLANNYYFLVTASAFNSTYVASDGIERNTAYNGNYVLNFLAGYCYDINTNNSISLNFKTVAAGNKRYIPIDLEASELAGAEIPDYSQAYKPQYDPYFRLDGRISYNVNFKKVDAEIAFDVQNITNNKNIMMQSYDPYSNQLRTDYQLGLFYVFLIRVQF
ncbi:MAG: TonB-dependent receptor [Bacteroidales bacterium]|nr:TonB-dependent receptor [Bacteroidales bacterium]